MLLAELSFVSFPMPPTPNGTTLPLITSNWSGWEMRSTAASNSSLKECSSESASPALLPQLPRCFCLMSRSACSIR